jgi:hypothetical protein
MRTTYITLALALALGMTACGRRDEPAARQAGREAYRTSQEIKKGAREAAKELRKAGKEMRKGWNEAKHEDPAPRKK